MAQITDTAERIKLLDHDIAAARSDHGRRQFEAQQRLLETRLTDEMLFDGAHFAHIAAYYERERLARIDRRCRDAAERGRPVLRARWAA